MAISLGDKAHRALKLLLGLRNPRIASAMAVYGLTDAEIQEGWSLLQALGTTKLGIEPFQPNDVKTLRDLDTWENHWFPVASASLARRFPATHARLFLNLSQSDGPEVAISVGTFVQRFDQMTAADSPYGPEGAKAKELLATRGITPAVVDEARSLLAQLKKVAPPPVPPSVEAQRVDLDKSVDALWAWYLEWSQVARIAVRQRLLLRQLGFLADSGSTGDMADEGGTAVPAPAGGGPTPPAIPAPNTGVPAAPSGAAPVATK